MPDDSGPPGRAEPGRPHEGAGSLPRRACQQEALALLARRAFERADAAALLEDAACTAARCLEVDLALVFEREPGGERLLVRASAGGDPGAVGSPVAVDPAGTLAGAALAAGGPVAVEDLRLDRRYAGDPLLHDHGLAGAMAAPFSTPAGPRGVLAAGSRRPRAFSGDDVDFLRGLAALLGAAVGRADADRELRDSEERLAGIVSSAMDAIISVDEDQRVLLFNAAAEEMFRCPAAEAIGSPISRFIPERFRARHSHHVRSFGETGTTARRMGALGTLAAIRADGEEFPIEATISQANVAGRRIFAVVIRDIVERQRAEEALREASRRKDEFLALLGHELRNPLSPIVTALQLMRLRDRDALERERQIIERQVRHLTRLVDDLLDVSRITRGKLALVTEPHDLRDAVARAVELASPLIEKRAQSLTVEVPEDLWVRIDLERFAQVLANLLTNAAKYTPEGGGIEVRAFRDGEAVAVAVRDTGRGIPAKDLPHLFDAFFQVERSLEHEGGLGLGLALVKSLVELHGGTAEAASAGPGLGSEFTVRVPSAARPSPEEAADRPRPRAFAVPALARRVLVVDDVPEIAEGVADFLKAHGHHVEVAHDGPQALALAESFRFDVALLDIGMPVMDGWELARSLRAAGQRGRIVAVTGYGQDTDRARSAAAGFAAHLTKPVPPERLLAVVEAPEPGSGAPAA